MRGKKIDQVFSFSNAYSHYLFALWEWGSSSEGQKLELLFDKIIIFASCCTGVTEVWDLAQRRTRLKI